MMDWIRFAKVGDKVVCTQGAEIGLPECGYWAPKTGRVYTIRGIYFGPEHPGLNLEEYVHRDNHPAGIGLDGIEIGWDARRFRPVQPRSTDITIFTDMLKTVGKPVTEDA